MASQILCREPTPPIDDNFGYPTPPCDLQEFTGETPSRGSTASLGDVAACEAGAPITGTNTPPPQYIPFNHLKYWYTTVMPSYGLPTHPSPGPDPDPNWVILFQDLETIASTASMDDQMVDYHSENESYIAQGPTDELITPSILEEWSSLNDNSSEHFQTNLQIHLLKQTQLEMKYQAPGITKMDNESGQKNILPKVQQEAQEMALDTEEASEEIREILPRSQDCQESQL